MAFNEDTRVKIPAILHLCRLGYEYFLLPPVISDPFFLFQLTQYFGIAKSKGLGKGLKFTLTSILSSKLLFGFESKNLKAI
jgi:hypothetical protein